MLKTEQAKLSLFRCRRSLVQGMDMQTKTVLLVTGSVGDQSEGNVQVCASMCESPSLGIVGLLISNSGVPRWRLHGN